MSKHPEKQFARTRRQRLIGQITAMMLGILILLLSIAACNMTSVSNTPTPEPLQSLTATLAQTSTHTLTPSATFFVPDNPIEIVTSEPRITQVAGVPTIDAPAPPTAGPYEYIIQDNDSLYTIFATNGRLPFRYVYSEQLVAQIVNMNENIPNPDSIPPPGSVIMLPPPTATEIPEGIDLTLTSDSSLGLGTRVGSVVLSGESGCYNVEDGDSLIEIASNYDTTLGGAEPAQSGHQLAGL